ncbi:rhamnogalacturonan lyase [Paenibacillus sp. LHD-38]|uniref:rhamnogalacturonan lyase n=1 Tax=Paenibacillus sp. LHD-38 TaxID=3072143 RepID=UPI00280CD4E0|nr:rhamnogalacturonan lyase [Paenibacillus sp. LHD-38]MDQ8739279.1 rhamnogalacturonan lyase [Paenibacillus sp. LHD-38]
MGIRKPAKIISVVLAMLLLLASMSSAFGEEVNALDVEGYETVDYTDFGDEGEVVPTYWGFTPASSTVAIHTEGLGGNATPKLQYNIVNQSGGRIASKTFASPVGGAKVLFEFDWYPGKVNDKGDRQFENGGEVKFFDSAGNAIFTINHTNNASLSYYVGRQERAATSFTNPEAWYHAKVAFDLVDNEAALTLQDQSGATEQYTASLDGVNFSGSFGMIRLQGVRTSGNNLTWTTFLDNFGIYNVPMSDDAILKVDDLPYHRVYVGETTEELSSLGLPDQVSVTLADDSKVDVPISEWVEIGSEWDPDRSGVYEFRGTLVETDGTENVFGRYATLYVYNRLHPVDPAQQVEWLDRSVIALPSEDGIFISWRLLADEYDQGVKFNIFRNGKKLNDEPLFVTNFMDAKGKSGDVYTVETLVRGASTEKNKATASATDYLSIPLQKPEGGTTATGDYMYSSNDASVGDLDGDGEYEVIVLWTPSNAMMALEDVITGPAIFDAYKLDGTLLWRMNMGPNLTSGPQYHQFVVGDMDGDGKSEFLIKSADGTTVYGATNGVYDSSKVISVIGDPGADWVNDGGHVVGGPEYISVFDGTTGAVIDTIDFAFPVEKVPGDGGTSWGDNFYNRSDRFLAAMAYLDGVTPSAIYGRGYYARTGFAAYSLVNGELQELWTFDSDESGRGGGLGNHNLAVGDLDNDGFDEIVAGSLTLDHDGTILYAMDGEMGRVQGSHGDALHVGAFDPDREGLHVFGVREETTVASLEYHDGATGETLKAFYAYKDAGRGVAANITSSPGYEFWGAGGPTVETGGGVYNVQGDVVEDSFRDIGLPVNFVAYWDGDLLHELLDGTTISKYDEATGEVNVIKAFEGVVSNNGTKANPTLQADIVGDWREEVIYRTPGDSELRLYSTTIPTSYRLYTLMHDPVYRMAIAWQNATYNQPPHIGFYLGEDIRDTVLAGQLEAENIDYTPNANAMRQTVHLGLDDPMRTKLTNALDQAEHQLSKGRPEQAAQSMQGFIKHLNSKSPKMQVEDELKANLIADAQRLIEEWKKLGSE